MRPFHEESLPPDLLEVARRLRAERADASPLDLDHIKTRAMARASASPRKGLFMRSRIVSLALVLGLIGSGSTAGVIAHHKSGHSGGSAASAEYKPGKGCGDKNHKHEREGECKKPPK